MSQYRTPLLFGGVALLFILTGIFQSWNLSLSILTMSLLSAIMALGVNMQWGYAGLFSTGIMGSVALGGLGVVLVSAKRIPAGWSAGGTGILGALLFAAIGIGLAVLAWPRLRPGRMRAGLLVVYLIGLFWAYRLLLDPAVTAVEANDPTFAGNIGGLEWNAIWGWPVGALLAALAAWLIGKIALGLRTDYLAIATLGIAEIVLMVLRNEDWLARGVKNLGFNSRPWPVPYEVDLQTAPWFLSFVADWGFDPTTASTILVKLMYCVLFAIVLLAVVWMSDRALHSPWGRMMRAIRDNEVSAAAMGKDVKRRHLQIFIIGSAVVGLAGAMMTSMDGQISPGSYQPLRYTFLIWIMVIVGGSGNNWGAVLGGLLIGWLYLAVEFVGPGILRHVTSVLPFPVTEDDLKNVSAHTRLMTLGIVLLLVLRFAPKGLLPEK